MAMKEKHRSSIYQSFVPILGEEEAGALLAQFPSRDVDEAVTKEYLGTELAKIRTEIAHVRTEIAGVRGELRTEMQQLVNRLYVAMITCTAVTIAGVSLVVANVR